MPRLVRNTTPDGSCKYGLVRVDKLNQMDAGQQVALIRHIEVLKAAGIYEVAGKNDTEEAFVIKLKDIHARHALFAYAHSMVDYDPEFAKEVFELAARSAGRKDTRHPTP